MTDHLPPEIERNHDASFRAPDETSRGSRHDGQSVAAFGHAPYRDDAETLRARRRELEAELRSLGARERELRTRAAAPHAAPTLAGLARRALGYVLCGATLGAMLGAAVATGAVALSLRDAVELDPHAELTHRRTVARAIRHVRDLERASALRARDAVVAAAASPEASVTSITTSPLFGGVAQPVPAAFRLPACGVVDRVSPMPSEDNAELLVTQLADTVWDVDRAALEHESRTSRVRAIPAEEHGRVIGVRLYGIRGTSLLGQLGLHNGDLLVAVNRHPLGDDPGLLGNFAAESRIVLALVRHGVPRTHTYLLRDAHG